MAIHGSNNIVCMKGWRNEMYCRNCGKEIPEGGRFCPECGCIVADSPVESAVPSVRTDAVDPGMTYNKRSEDLALPMSLFITGLGHIYVGKAGKGVALLIAQILCSALGVITLFTWVGSVILWFYGMYDSYALAKQYNTYVMSHNGQPPW